jgi:hypothetical protein
MKELGMFIYMIIKRDIKNLGKLCFEFLHNKLINIFNII